MEIPTASESDSERRAQIRRTTWQAGTAKLGPAADAADRAFWRSATLDQRFDAVVLMALEVCAMEGGDGIVPRLRGSAGGIRKA